MKKIFFLFFMLLSSCANSKVFEYKDESVFINLNVPRYNEKYLDFSINMKWNKGNLISPLVRAKLISREEIDEDINTGESYLSMEYWGVLDNQCEIGIRLDAEKKERLYLRNIDCPKIEFDLSDKMLIESSIKIRNRYSVEEKEKLAPVFKSILDELDLDKAQDSQGNRFEAGKLKDLLLSPVQQRRLTGIVAKHDSEWKKTRAADFSQTCGVYRANGKEEIAKRIEKRVEDLSIKLEVDEFNTDKQAYYLHPLGLIGWLAVKAGKQIDRAYFFDEYQKRFTKLTYTQKNALENIFTGIEEYCENDKSYVCSLKKIAYMLATAKHETGHTFEPITERGNRSYFNKYDPVLANTPERRKRAIEMENTQQGDGFKYRGRGYV
jgi:glycoside hydrolase, family 19, putative